MNDLVTYFAASIRGGRQDVAYYEVLVACLLKYGVVLTEHVADPTLKEEGEDLTVVEIHDRDMAMISQSNRVIAEVSNPSLGVGYEIGRVVERGHVIVDCFWRYDAPNKLSAMIAGSDGTRVWKYERKEEFDALIPFVLEKGARFDKEDLESLVGHVTDRTMAHLVLQLKQQSTVP